MTADQSGNFYSVSATNISEGVVSSGPTILSQPSVVVSGETATISVVATAAPSYNIAYQWLFDGAPINGANEPSVSVTLDVKTVGTYSVIVSELGLSYCTLPPAIISNGFALTLEPPFSVSSDPTSQAIASGASATFSVSTTGTVAPTYQWVFNGNVIPGATAASYTIADAQVSSSGAYVVTVTDQGRSVTSRAGFLTVTAQTGGPTIAAQPQSYVTYPGGTVVLTVTLSAVQASLSGRTTDATAVTYQWYDNGTPMTDGGGVSGSQTPTLVLSGAATQPGGYVCLIENSAGAVVSQASSLAVLPTTDIGRLINVSCRALVGKGPNILIAGFIVGGSGTSGSQSLLIRASGPALSPFDVAGTLPDPELQLFSTSSGIDLLATNTGWGGNSEISSTALSVGAFAWADSASHDAALLEGMAPGPYTANISGENGDSGVALAEIYDATPEGTYAPAKPRLVNISARVQVGAGGNTLIAGFVIGGSTSKTVLIRASGPALAPFGVTGTLPDPQLQLFQSNGSGTSTLLQSDTGWGGNAQIAATAASVGAFSWGASATPDSAILITLLPGAYTAEVSGAGGDTGVALVEVYEVQ